MSWSESTPATSVEQQPEDNSQREEITEGLSELKDRDKAFDAINDFVDAILDSAEDDETKNLVREYLEATSSLGLYNYSFRNQLLLFLQMDSRNVEYKNSARFFTGYQTWQKDHGRHVKSGETGYKIIAPVTGTTCPECGNAPSYHTNDFLDCSLAGSHPNEWDFDPQEEWSEGVIFFKSVTTFAYQQTGVLDDADPEDVFKPPEEDNEAYSDGHDPQDLFDALAEAAESGEFEDEEDGIGKIEVTVDEARSPMEMAAGGWSKGGEVYVTEQDNISEMFRILIHEIAHEINHSNNEESLPEPVKEVSAEAIAFVVGSHFGIQNLSSDLYIATWVKHAEEQAAKVKTTDENEDEERETARSVIKNRLDNVQEASAEIIESIENVQ